MSPVSIVRPEVAAALAEAFAAMGVYRDPQPAAHRLLVPEPTAALPGTEEKLVVLSGRVIRGEALWHPADALGPAGGKGVHYRQPVLP